MKIAESERLILRHFKLSDVARIYNFSQEDSLKKWIPDQVYENMQEAKETLLYLISKSKNFEYPFVVAVVKKDINQIIGHVGLSEIKQVIEIGYGIGEEFINNGYATEAVYAMVKYAPQKFNLDTVYGFVDNENYSSIKVLHKAGFTYVDKDTELNKDKYIKKII